MKSILKNEIQRLFYSNSYNYAEIKRFLDNVTNYFDQKWKSKILPKLNEFRCFDMNNTLLKKNLKVLNSLNLIKDILSHKFKKQI